jgi:hypothetical protein
MTTTYLTQDRISRLVRNLSDRDWAVIHTVKSVRVASAPQLERLHFTGVGRRQTRSALASLVAREFLTRLPRVIGGTRAGSSGFVYVLGPAGQRVIRPDLTRTRRPWTVGLPFLAHSLAVTELFVSLAEACRASAGERVLEDFRTEPVCWRTISYGQLLKPDAEAVIRQGGYEDRWFFEVDRGTESPATLDRRLGYYVAYWRTGREQSTIGVFPRVLWIVPDAARHAVLIDAFGRQPIEAWPLFAASTTADAIDRITRGAGV